MSFAGKTAREWAREEAITHDRLEAAEAKLERIRAQARGEGTLGSFYEAVCRILDEP